MRCLRSLWGVSVSYNIAVVVPPIPPYDKEAWAEIDGLIRQAGDPPSVFRELHDARTARYPCICALPEDRVDEAVWSDGPLWNNFGHRAAVLGISGLMPRRFSHGWSRSRMGSGLLCLIGAAQLSTGHNALLPLDCCGGFVG